MPRGPEDDITEMGKGRFNGQGAHSCTVSVACYFTRYSLAGESFVWAAGDFHSHVTPLLCPNVHCGVEETNRCAAQVSQSGRHPRKTDFWFQFTVAASRNHLSHSVFRDRRMNGSSATI